MGIEYSQGRPSVAFIHLTRTGGSSFRKMLRSIYGNSYHFLRDPTVAGVQTALATYEAVEFHMVTIGIHRYLTHGEVFKEELWDIFAGRKVFSLLRSPVDHYLSVYYHLHQRREIDEPSFRARGMPFSETLEQFMAWPQTYNSQIGYFLGLTRYKDGSCIERHHLEKAKDVVRKLPVHFGLTERFAESVHLFESITGLRLPARSIVTVNGNPDRPPLKDAPQSILDTIRSRSELEIEFYDFVQERFLEELEKAGPMPELRFAEEPTVSIELATAPIATAPLEGAPVVPGLWARIKGAFAEQSLK